MWTTFPVLRFDKYYFNYFDLMLSQKLERENLMLSMLQRRFEGSDRKKRMGFIERTLQCHRRQGVRMNNFTQDTDCLV